MNDTMATSDTKPNRLLISVSFAPRMDCVLLASIVGSHPYLVLVVPETTVMLADIVGFTAWSSVREPSQVFSLLEALFRAFDDCASRRRVFKVCFQSLERRRRNEI